jgi:NADH-quinone oxidoreductase subunit M
LIKQQKYDVADLSYHCRQDSCGKLFSLLDQESACRTLFSKKGVFHKAIRRPVNPDWLGQAWSILVTRDPRDIMTSMYFSFKHSHVILKEADRSRKSKMETIAIDEFVLQSGQLEAMVDRLERYQEYLKNPQGYHFVERADWINLNLGTFGRLNIDYFLAVDGLSIGLLLLSAFVMFIAAIASNEIKKDPKAYYTLFLLLSAAIMGVFCALDFFLFYVFYELMLLPMYFLIGMWGGPNREYASIKFFLY